MHSMSSRVSRSAGLDIDCDVQKQLQRAPICEDASQAIAAAVKIDKVVIIQCWVVMVEYVCAAFCAVSLVLPPLPTLAVRSRHQEASIKEPGASSVKAI
mmetsp:Transcript_169740/g.544761  ORF Transcript_169740/g.544761 Transcript_169740/m.544761 type:complete len:99 (-) Transcript_169740:207-503(-)